MLQPEPGERGADFARRSREVAARYVMTYRETAARTIYSLVIKWCPGRRPCDRGII